MSYIDDVNSLMKFKDAMSISSEIEQSILHALTNNEPRNKKERYIHNLINKKTIETTPLALALIDTIIKQQEKIKNTNELIKAKDKTICDLQITKQKADSAIIEAQQLQEKYKQRMKSIPETEKIVCFIEHVCETIASHYPDVSIGKCNKISKPQRNSLKARIENCILVLSPTLLNYSINLEELEGKYTTSNLIDIDIITDHVEEIRKTLKETPNSERATSRLSDMLDMLNYTYENGCDADEELISSLTFLTEKSKATLIELVREIRLSSSDNIEFNKVINDYINEQIYQHTICYEEVIEQLDSIIEEDVDDIFSQVEELFGDEDSNNEAYDRVIKKLSNIKQSIAASSEKIYHHIDFTKGYTLDGYLL